VIAHKHRPVVVRFLRLPRRPGPEEFETDRLTAGQRAADWFTRQLGSWRFIVAQSVLMAGWLVLNVVAWVGHWDPYPFILLNLALSFQAAYAGPIILMSQNRQAAKDRLTAEHDCEVDRQAELEVEAIQSTLERLAGEHWDALLRLQERQLELLNRIEALTGGVHAVTTSPPRRATGADPTGRKMTPPQMVPSAMARGRESAPAIASPERTYDSGGI
jgi:uncharacterized membrane protein